MTEIDSKNSVSRAGRPKSEEKRKAIIHSATGLFLKYGVKATSMEQIAKESGVSKQTIYSHFSGKDNLFSSVITCKCEEYLVGNEAFIDKNCSLEKALETIAIKFLKLFHDEDVIAMYSIIISEARNSPKVAKLFYDAGPYASLKALTKGICVLTKGRLDSRTSELLATDFYSLLKGDLQMRSLMNMEFRLNENEQMAYVQTVVKRTMCLYHHYYLENIH